MEKKNLFKVALATALLTLTCLAYLHSDTLNSQVSFLSFPPQGGNGKFKVLAFYDGTYDGGHISYVHEALDWFPKAAQKYGFTFEATKDWGKLNSNNLAKYQVVIFLDNKPYDWNQRNAFQQYVQKGGGFMGFHVTAFAEKASEWSWYHNEFLGSGAFAGNTWGPTAVTAKVENNWHASLKGLPQKFKSSVSEWYRWSNDLRKNSNIKVLVSIDQSSFPVGTDPNQSWYSGYYPIAWTNIKYKMIYTNWGHNDIDYSHGNKQKSWTFSNQETQSFTINSLFYLAGQKY